jgi:hypothetical protein
MPSLPGLADTIVLGFAGWAAAVALHTADLAAPLRRVGVWSKRLPWLLQAPFLPAQAAAQCLFCTMWWVAAAAVGAVAPGWVTGAIGVAAAVGVATAIDSCCLSLSRLSGYDPAETPEQRLAKLARSQTLDAQFNTHCAAEAERFRREMSAPPPPPPR